MLCFFSNLHIFILYLPDVFSDCFHLEAMLDEWKRKGWVYFPTMNVFKMQERGKALWTLPVDGGKSFGRRYKVKFFLSVTWLPWGTKPTFGHWWGGSFTHLICHSLYFLEIIRSLKVRWIPKPNWAHQLGLNQVSKNIWVIVAKNIWNLAYFAS